MIQGFFYTVQKDALYISANFNKTPIDDDEKLKTSIVACRIFGAIVMGLSVLGAIRSVNKAALFSLIGSAALYAAGHDLFVIGLNVEKDTVSQVTSISRSILDAIENIVNANKNVKQAFSNPLTEGTFFRPLWDKAFAAVRS